MKYCETCGRATNHRVNGNCLYCDAKEYQKVSGIDQGLDAIREEIDSLYA